MASPEAETFLWRRIKLDEQAGKSHDRVPGAGAIFLKKNRGAGLYATIFVNGCRSQLQPSNASTPTEPLRALHCLLQTVSPKRETIKIGHNHVKRGRGLGRNDAIIDRR